MTEDNEKLIEVILKVLQLNNGKINTIDSESVEVAWAAKRAIETLNTALAMLIERVDNVEMWQKHRRNQPELIIDSYHKTTKGLKERFDSIETDFHLNLENLNKLKDLQNRVDALEFNARPRPQLGKKRGPYKKRNKESGTVVLQVGPPTTDNGSNVFGAKTTSKYNKAISRALNSLHFTKQEIIAEVRSKHAKIHRFAGKELLYQVRKAKWRLDGRRRRKL